MYTVEHQYYMVLGESGLKYIDIIVKITAPLKE
jgi:hypothetical protein